MYKKLYETDFGKENFLFFRSIEDYFNYLDKNDKDISFKTKEGYNLGDEVECLIDNKPLVENTSIIYTTEEYPIAIGEFDSFVNPTFFDAHKEEFKNYALKELQKKLENKNSYILIPNYIISDETIKLIINSGIKNVNIFCSDVDGKLEISEDQRKLIQDNHLEFAANYRFKKAENISTNRAIGNYTFDDLREHKKILIKIPDDLKNINNLSYAMESATIIISNGEISGLKSYDEKKYFDTIIKVMNVLSTHNRKYNIKIEVDNRELLRQTNLIYNIPSNVNLLIETCLKGKNNSDYDLETYKREEEKIEKIVGPIRNSNLSTFEKYLACYNIVKKFKPYKENNSNRKSARSLKYILDDGNEYIVCVGFSNLLSELLNRVGIPNMQIDLDVDISYDSGYTLEDKSIKNAGHRRNLIQIDDDKYNIHGVYIADSTWDNDLDNDFYNNAVLTFEQKKKAKRLESLASADLILDFNSFEEFNKKINYFLKDEIAQNMVYSNNETKAIISAYSSLYDKILTILYYIDQKKYFEYYNKYNNYFSDYYISLKEIEIISSELLTDYANYIIPLSNNEVNLNTILDAGIIIKKEIDHYSDDNIKEWLEIVKLKNQERQQKYFPYGVKLNDNIQAREEDYMEKSSKTK